MDSLQLLEDLELGKRKYHCLHSKDLEQWQTPGWALNNCWKTLNMEDEISLLAYKGFGTNWQIPGWPLYNNCLQNRS